MTPNEGTRYTPLLGSEADPEAAAIKRPKSTTQAVEIPHFVPAYEGLRGVAVLLTIISHIHKLPLEFGQATGRGGVAVFFVLSGFLITGVLTKLHERYARSPGPSFEHLPRFYTDRLVRLYPALIAMVLSTGLLHLYLIDWNVPSGYFGNAIMALAYLSSFEFPGAHVKSIWDNTWSLACEEQYYIWWAILLPYLLPMRASKRTSVILSLLFASLGLKTMALTGIVTQPAWLFSYKSSFVSFWKMLLGSQLRLSKPPAWMRRGSAAWMGLGLLLLLQLCALPEMPVDLVRLGFSRRWFGIGVFIEPVAAIATVLIIMGSMEGNWFLETALLRFVGRVSYSFYLYQVPMLLSRGWPRGIVGFEISALAFVASMLSTLYLEEPLRLRYRRWRETKMPR